MPAHDRHGAASATALRDVAALTHGDRCVYCVDDHADHDILPTLAGSGIDVDRAIGRGALVCLPADGYRRPGEFDPASMLEHLDTAVARARADGFTGVRIVAEMSWALTAGVEPRALLEYERLANVSFFPRTSCTALCAYNQRRFPPALLEGALRTHPFVVMTQRVC